MPTLDENQRAWLDKALQSKGRFTRAASIRKEWEDYRRRRDKAVANSAGLPPEHPNRKLIDNGIRDADALAKDGKFAQAYKALDSIKKMGATASVERARTISISGIETELNVLRSKIGNVKSTVEFAHRFYGDVFDRVDQLTPCSAQPDLTAATLHLKGLNETAAELMIELAVREKWMYRASDEVRAAGFRDHIERIERDIAVHVTAGHADKVANATQRLQSMKAEITTPDNRYFNPDYVVSAVAERRGTFETAMRALRDISMFKGTVENTRDPSTEQVRDRLEPTTNLEWLEQEEEDRLALARRMMVSAGLKDSTLQSRTKERDVEVAPELDRFDGDTMFEDLSDAVFGQGNDMPEALTMSQIEALIAGAGTKLRDEIANLDPAGDEMFDLMLKTPKELASLACLKLTGIADLSQAGDALKELFTRMGREMRKAILENSPNRMKDDKSEIVVNGQTYTLVDTIGEGANGAIRRYTDGTKTFVVKSLKRGEERSFGAMAEEMRTHKRLMDGAGEGSENIVEMKGAAVSNDGALHMMMEEVEGGDMTTVGNNLVMLESLGVLPPEAKRVLSLDLIAQTVKGMMAMQQSGLVHNDLKPQNMMIARDGTVKIIDFGESRFVDEQTETIPGAGDGDYNTTPGYEAPEHWGGDQGVTSKADSFALSGIMKILMDPSMSEASVLRGQKPVGALGRIVAALSDPDPKKRPALDTVLVSSLMDQVSQNANPQDVRDLQVAAAEVNTAMRGLKATISAEDLRANAPSGKGMTDTMWLPYLEKGLQNGAEVPIAAFQTMVTKLDDKLRELRGKLAGGSPDGAQDLRDKIAEAERQKKFWMAEVTRQMDGHRAEGKKELDDLLADPANTTTVPGKGGGKMTLKDAVALRERNLSDIDRLQKDFYTLANDRPDMAQAWLDETNATLNALADQAAAIEKAVVAAAGPKARYFLAEQKMSEIAARFGPRKTTGEEIRDKATPKSPPVQPPMPPQGGDRPNPPPPPGS
ncbi:MAG: protein kinase family protein [Paracoccaceae bacterium]|nr:MAG: protein kinase family protein [Paracoccaceae bacterium]